MITLLARRGLLLATLSVASLALVTAAASAAPALDSSFGGGVVTPKVFPNGKWRQIARGAVVQADGKIVVPMGLSARYGNRTKRPVLRYNADGTLDASYGKNGKAWFRLPGRERFALSGISLQSDGKALVTGVTDPPRRWLEYYTVTRLTTTGAPDKTFGKGGSTLLDSFGDGDGWVRALIGTYPLSNGKILVAFKQEGEKEITLDFQRLHSNGRVDRGYGGNGTKTVKLAANRWFTDIADIEIVGDDAFVLVNPEPEDSEIPCTVIKTNISSKGRRVATFGGDGRVVLGPGVDTNGILCTDLTPTTGGGLVVVGFVYEGDHEHPGQAISYMLRPDGSRERTFGAGGKVLGAPGDGFTAIAETSTGEFLTIGRRSRPMPAEGTEPWDGSAYSLTAAGLLTNIAVGGLVPSTPYGTSGKIDHRSSGNVVVFSNEGSQRNVYSRIVKFTN